MVVVRPRRVGERRGHVDDGDPDGAERTDAAVWNAEFAAGTPAYTATGWGTCANSASLTPVVTDAWRCSDNSSRPSAASIAIVIMLRVLRSSVGSAHRSPQTLVVIHSSHARFRSVAFPADRAT